MADLTWNDPKQPFRYQENFIFSLFSTVQIWFLRGKKFVLQFLIDILALGSGFVDPHNFAEQDPER